MVSLFGDLQFLLLVPLYTFWLLVMVVTILRELCICDYAMYHNFFKGILLFLDYLTITKLKLRC